MSNRKFTVGRQSEQLLNEELYKLFESIKPLLEPSANGRRGPNSSLNGSLWLDEGRNELNSYRKDKDEWEIIFKDRFQIVDQLLSELTPSSPVLGQLWINQGMLWYYTGQGWHPIRAFDPESSEVYFSSFEDFLLLSPMQPQNNSVVDKSDVDGELSLVSKSQFLTPNIKTGRYYVDHVNKVDYEQMNQVSLQYPEHLLKDSRPSWVHVNPARLTKIEKRIIKIDKDLHSIDMSTMNTEIYGFKKNSPLGHFFRPIEEEQTGDYYITPTGIMLHYDAAHKFDYLMTITYDFSWIKSSGVLSKTSTGDSGMNFYVGDFSGPLNVFTDGYDLENDAFYHDVIGKTVNITDRDLSVDTEVSILKSSKNEYGIIQSRTLDGRGIIKMRKRFTNPIVFVNGQALHASLGDVEIDEGTILVANARKGMSYCIMELYDGDTNMLLSSGVVSEGVGTQGYVSVPNLANIPEGEGLVLFVDGLLVKKDDIIRDYVNNVIYAEGLQKGQDYLLLHDPLHMLLFDLVTRSALVTGSKVDESLLFMNGYLLCSDSAIVTTSSEKELSGEGHVNVHGEVKLFLTPSEEKYSGEYKIWNNYKEEWVPCDALTIQDFKQFAFSYENSLSAIVLNVDYDDDDVFDVFAYNFAHTIENPLAINTREITDEQDIEIKEFYVYGSNSLQVFLNGVRQYHIEERTDGTGFRLAEPATGTLTYIVERPEGGADRTCEREILDERHVVANSPNAYRTSISLYPGRVTIYVNGLRQPKESYVILDNYTILFKDPDIKMVGAKENYPIETILKADGSGEYLEVAREQADEILVEVRQEFSRDERTYVLEEADGQEIDVERHNLPYSILDANDQILIFINGFFTGFRDNIEYRKDKQKGVITLLKNNYSQLINHDPLYTYFQMNIDKRIKWQEEHKGELYSPKIKNTITVEWR